MQRHFISFLYLFLYLLEENVISAREVRKVPFCVLMVRNPIFGGCFHEPAVAARTQLFRSEMTEFVQARSTFTLTIMPVVHPVSSFPPTYFIPYPDAVP